MAELERDDSKRMHALLLPNWHSAWGKAKAGPGAQLQLWLQVSIWDMGQGQSWGTCSYRLSSETWVKAKAGAQLQFQPG